jgi:HEAT repeat protein
LLRKDRNLLSGFERVALNTQYGKGRESFVMLLGQFGGQDVVDTLQKLLNDQEVQGHAVYALRLLGAPEVQDSILPFLQSPKTWVRNEAKKYFDKLDKQSSKL